MNVNNQAMPMGDNTGQAGDGQTGPKRHFKHIGELADQSKAKVEKYKIYRRYFLEKVDQRYTHLPKK